MNGIFNWVSQKFSKASNTAATSILSRILSMVIDQQDENSVKLELFNDWSMKLILRKVFLKPELINSSIDFLKLDSVYISDFSFNGAYNLSKHECNIETVVVELSLCQTEHKDVHENELTASLQNFRQQLPIEKHVSVQEWLFHYVESVKLKVKRFTAIIKTSPDLPPLVVEIHDFSFIINHSESALFSGKVGKILLFYGSKLSKTKIAESSKISFIANSESITLNFNDVEGTVDQTVLKHLATVIKLILQIIPKDSSEPSKQIVAVNIRRCKAAIGEYKFNVNDTEILVKETNVDLTIKSVNSNLITFKDPLYINVNLPTDDHFVLPQSCTINNIIEWEDKVFNSNIIRVKIITPEVTGNLPLKKFLNMVKTFQMFELLKIGDESDQTIVPVAVSLYLTKAKMVMDSFTLETTKSQLGIFISTEKDVDLQVNVIGTNIYSTLNGTMLVQSNSNQCEFACVVKLSDIIQVDLNLNNLVACVPRVEGINFIMEFVDEVLKINENNSGPSSQSAINLNFSNIFIDYMTFKMPARLLANVLDAKVFLTLVDNSLKGTAIAALSVFMSNLRQPLPLKALSSPNLLSRHGFAQILKGVLNDVNFSLQDNTKFSCSINHPTVAVGLCSDSFNLLLSLYAHILYGLEYGDIKINVQPKQSISQDIIKEQLMELMRLSFINVKNSEEQFTSSEKLTPSENLEEQKSVKFSESEDINGSENKEENLEKFSHSNSEIQLEAPKSEPEISISIVGVTVSILFYGGYDFEKIFDLRILQKTPEFTNENEDIDDGFEYVLTRNENPSLEIDTVVSLNLGIFLNDDISLRVIANSSMLDIIDHIPESKARLMLGLEEREKQISVIFDIMKSDNLRLSIELPSLGIFITQNQIDFLIDFFDRSIPIFESDEIVRPLKFDFFAIKGSSFLINAHFTFGLSVSIEDVTITLPMCAFASISSQEELVARLSEFYFDSLAWSAFSVASGLPVLSNFKRIGRAVYNLFRNFGGRSFSILMRTLATEVLNAGTCATSLTETLLSIAVEAGAGDEDWRRSPIASLIVTHRIGAIPNVVLMPGLKLASGATKMLKYVKDKVNPNARQERKRTKPI